MMIKASHLATKVELLSVRKKHDKNNIIRDKSRSRDKSIFWANSESAIWKLHKRTISQGPLITNKKANIPIIYQKAIIKNRVSYPSSIVSEINP